MDLEKKVEVEKCAWKEIINSKQNVEGYQINCLNCNGYNVKCPYYFTLKNRRKNE